MKSAIHFSVTTPYGDFRYSSEMPPILHEAAMPLRSTDVALLGAFPDLSGEYHPRSEAYQVKLQFRKDVAKELGEVFAELLLKHMSRQDTFNGYPLSGEVEGE